MSITPFHGKVLVAVLPDVRHEETTEAGLVIVHDDDGRTALTVRKAKVLAVGEGILLQDGSRSPPQAREGRYVLVDVNTLIPIEEQQDVLSPFRAFVEDTDILGDSSE